MDSSLCNYDAKVNFDEAHNFDHIFFLGRRPSNPDFPESVLFRLARYKTLFIITTVHVDTC